MKKFYLFLAATAAILGLTYLSVSPAKPINKPVSEPVTTIPNNLNTVFKNSCMSCHAAGGSGIAMSMLNFSKWDSYDPKKQAKKAAAICDEITTEAMPPKSFVKTHPEAALTASQKDSICKWSATLALKK